MIAPAVAVSLGARLQRGEVGAGVRLGEQLAPDLLAGEDRRQETLLLRVGAEVDDRGPGEALAERVETIGRAGTVVLLQVDRLLGQRCLAAAVGARPGEAGVPGGVDLSLELAEVRKPPVDRRRFGPLKARHCLLKGGPGKGSELRISGCVTEVHRRSPYQCL